MCIGIPGRIVALSAQGCAWAEVCGVRREINLMLVGSHDANGQSRVGQWVLIHVGFAMSLLDEDEARATLQALTQMGEVEPDVALWLKLGDADGIR